MKVCIVIPVYKEMPDQFEEIGLRQCGLILKNYPVFFVHPEGLKLDGYKKYFDEAQLGNFSFAKSYFRGTVSYNTLLTSSFFFEKFKDYDFFLMHHPDALVFRDELQEWCAKDFDYVGAPIYEFDGTIAPKNYLGVGNGGLSLHKVQSALKVLNSFTKVYSQKELWDWYEKYNWKGKLFYFPYYLRVSLGFGKYSYSGLNRLRVNEDIFWGVLVPNKIKSYIVAPFEEAYKFSMEYNCELLFRLNENQLPFGCHQWFKGEFLSFWEDKVKSHIKTVGSI